MEQVLNAEMMVAIPIPEDKILINKVEYQELKSKEFDGWVDMKTFEEKSNRSRTVITALLKKPEMIKRLDINNGGWVYYPPDYGKWSFHYKEMMQFINDEFYQKYNGGKEK